MQLSKFPCLKVIIDFTEIYTQKPSCLHQANKAIYSNYKGHTTFKFLVGIDPHAWGYCVCLKSLGGRTSDKHITANSNKITSSRPFTTAFLGVEVVTWGGWRPLVRVSWGGRVGSRVQILSWGVVLTSSWVGDGLTSSWAGGGLMSSWWGVSPDAILDWGWPDAMGWGWW